MIRHVLAAAMALAPLATAAIGAEACKSELPAVRTGHWSWRIVDGKHCWYRGHPGRDKATLAWPRPDPAAAPIDPDRELLESYWPALKLEENAFSERWPR